MNVCQVAPYAAYPTRMGGDHRTHGLMTAFHENGDHVTRYCQGGKPSTYKDFDLRRRVEIEENYVERRHFNPVNDAVKAPMLAGYPNLWASHALKVASDGLPDLLTTADLVFLREPWQAPFVLDNTPSDTPVVFSSHNVEIERFGTIDQPAFAGRVKSRVERLERRAVLESDAIIVTCEHDREEYESRYSPDAPIIVAPNGTYESSLHRHTPDSPEANQVRAKHDIPQGAPVCLFVGTDYKPNVEAARSAAATVQHLNNHRQLTAHLLIVGSVGNSLNEDALPPNVHVTGYIPKDATPDFTAHFDAADIALNPTTTGGGSNIKLADYLAHGLPTITTPFGARGFDVEDGTHLITAPINDFPEHIHQLHADTGYRQRLGNNARQLVKDKYTWRQISIALRDDLHDILDL